jgi:hypothetical protein
MDIQHIAMPPSEASALDGKKALITPAPAKKTASLQELQSVLKYDAPRVSIDAMRVTDYKG